MTRFLLPFLVLGCSNEDPDTASKDIQNQNADLSDTEQAWANEYLQSMNELVANEGVYADINRIEKQALELEKSFFLPFERLLQSNEVPSTDAVSAFLSGSVGQSNMQWSALPTDASSLEDLNEGIYKGDVQVAVGSEGGSFGEFLQTFQQVDAFQ